MSEFWKVCNACKGRGEVPPQHPAARPRPNMTGELVDRSVSVCKKCQGAGTTYKGDMPIIKMTREEWANTRDQQSRIQ